MGLGSVVDIEALRTSTWQIQQSRLTAVLEGEHERLSDELLQATYHQISNGKRLRAVLPLALATAIGVATGQPLAPVASDAAIWCGLSLEFLHAASLCHDDVIDGDRLRRGEPTVWAQFGTEQAIVVGDFLLLSAYNTVHFAPWPAETKLEALRLLDRSAVRVAHGQALETQLKRHRQLPTNEAYRNIARGKTGGLFSLGCAWGGLAMSLTRAEVEALDELGMQLGELYQVYDDLIDLTGSKGRDVDGGDLWEGKPSWLVAQRAEALSGRERERLRDLVYMERADKTAESVAELRAWLLGDGTADACRKWLDDKKREIVGVASVTVPTAEPLFTQLVEVFTRHAGRPAALAMG